LFSVVDTWPLFADASSFVLAVPLHPVADMPNVRGRRTSWYANLAAAASSVAAMMLLLVLFLILFLTSVSQIWWY
jgi:hypothetical protein